MKVIEVDEAYLEALEDLAQRVKAWKIWDRRDWRWASILDHEMFTALDRVESLRRKPPPVEATRPAHD